MSVSQEIREKTEAESVLPRQSFMLQKMFRRNDKRLSQGSFHPGTFFFPDAETAGFQFGNEQFFSFGKEVKQL